MNSSNKVLLLMNSVNPPQSIDEILTGYRVTVVENIADLQRRRAAGGFDSVLVTMPDSDFDLSGVLSADPSLPVIVVAQNGDAAGAVRAIKAGAQDYIVMESGWEDALRQAVQDAHEAGQRSVPGSTFSDAPLIMLAVDRDGLICEASTHTVTELGYSHETLIGKPLVSLMVGESAARIVSHDLPQVWHAGSINGTAHQMRSAGGTLIDVLLDMTVTASDTVVVVAHDVTEQRRIEYQEREQRVLSEALRDTTAALNSTLDFEEVLDRILSNVARVVPYDTGTIMLIEAGRARVVRNQRASEPGLEIKVPTHTFEIGDTPTLRSMFTSALPLAIPDTREYPDWVELPQSAWIRSFVGAPILEDERVIGFVTLNSGTRSGFTQVHADRLAIFAHHASIAIRNARLFDAAQKYASELEQRVARRTAQLNLERNQLRAILESTGEGIVYTEGDRIEYVNQTFTALSGYAAEELIGQSLDIVDPETHIIDQWVTMQQTVRDDDVWRVETALSRRDGTRFEAGMTVSFIGPLDEDPVRAVTVVRDISQEKRLQAQKANFIAIASHELRTPITNILTRLYLMKNQPEEMNEHMAVMTDVVRRMRRLVEDLLDMSRFERGMIQLDHQRVELQQLLSDVVRVQYAEAQAKNISLKIDLTTHPQHVDGDSERLAQVITNLVTNALTYTPSGGEVVVMLTTDGEDAIINVKDTGVGIAPENVEQIFEPFMRVNEKVKGTGLGLSIAREIVELHGGSISVTSQPEQGSCFTVRLKLMSVLA